MQSVGFDRATKLLSFPTNNTFSVLYTASSADLGHPIPLRTYSGRGRSLNPTIVEATCATIATPAFFSPVVIGPRMRQQNFVGGPWCANNPTRELLKEATNAFGKDRRVAQILSIGSGRPKVLAVDSLATTDNVRRLAEVIGMNCEMVAKELSTRLFSADAYLRLNVDRGMESVQIDDWNGLGVIEGHTNAYLETTAVAEALEASLRRLYGRVGTLTLGQIST